MIHHNVLFKFKEGTSEEVKNAVIRELEALNSEIPEIHSLQVGRNFSDRGKDFELMLISTFQTKADLEVYGKHPKPFGCN